MRLFLTFIIVLSFFANKAHATALPPQPICEITAMIITVGEDHLEIEVLESGSLVKEGHDPNWNCSHYEAGTNLKNVIINTEDFKNKNQYNAGTILKGNIQFTGDEHGTGYFFTNIEITEE